MSVQNFAPHPYTVIYNQDNFYLHKKLHEEHRCLSDLFRCSRKHQVQKRIVRTFTSACFFSPASS